MIRAMIRRLLTWRQRATLARVRTADAAFWTAAESDWRERADKDKARAGGLPLWSDEHKFLLARSRHADCMAQAAFYRAGGDTESARIWDEMAEEYARQARWAARAMEGANV